MTPLKRQFFRYALPSMLSQLLNSCFIIVDGFFIGRNLGDIGLAAINVAWPITAFIQAVSLGLGLGGAVRLSTALGRGDKEEAALARGNTLTALAAAGVAMSVGLWLACPVILPLIGAKGELYAPALEYSRMICALALGQTINTGVLPLLRGSHKTIQAMSFTIVGLLGNIFMDWLFIQAFQWGLAGAAVATGSAQILCAVLALPCLLASRELPLRRADFAPRWGMLRRIVQYGVSPFGLSISTSVILLITNLQALHWGGTRGVAVYAVLSYVLGAVIPLVSGVGDGVQPLLSHARGAGEWEHLAQLRRWGLCLAVGWPSRAVPSPGLAATSCRWCSGPAPKPPPRARRPSGRCASATPSWRWCAFAAATSARWASRWQAAFWPTASRWAPSRWHCSPCRLFWGLPACGWPGRWRWRWRRWPLWCCWRCRRAGGARIQNTRNRPVSGRNAQARPAGRKREEPPWKRKRPLPALPAVRW